MRFQEPHIPPALSWEIGRGCVWFEEPHILSPVLWEEGMRELPRATLSVWSTSVSL